ncbi:MAG: hypothetical protein R3284_07885 [Rubricoccaceae bacterium]|nr:hypothetical protein [Rubricoccaceae bacterium]
MNSPRLVPLAALFLSPLLLFGCNRYNYDGVSYPAYAKAGSSGGNDTYHICHNGRNELTLPEPAIRAHLNHGDYFGACNERDRGRHDDHYRGRGNRGRGNSGR